MRSSTKPPALAAALLGSVLLGSVLLGPAAQAATVKLSTDTPHVCDWRFSSGPRAGQEGKESRAWIGTLPTYTTIAWWPVGPPGALPVTYTLTYSFPNAFSRWDIDIDAGTEIVTGRAEVARNSVRYAPTKHSTMDDLSNGGQLSCQELNYQVRRHLRVAYKTPGAPCDCNGNFAYDDTVGCIERCVERWNNDSKWIGGAAPECLDSDSVRVQLLCLLSFDPRLPLTPAECFTYPHDPRCGLVDW